MSARSIILVLVQAVCSIGIVFSNGLIPGNILLLLLLAGGFILGLWAMAEFKFRFNVFPELLKNSRLITSGPYRVIRHPIYTSVLMITCAYTLNYPVVLNIVLWFTLLIVLVIKLRYEEKLLKEEFPDYEDYRSKTKALIPFIV